MMHIIHSFIRLSYPSFLQFANKLINLTIHGLLICSLDSAGVKSPPYDKHFLRFFKVGLNKGVINYFTLCCFVSENWNGVSHSGTFQPGKQRGSPLRASLGVCREDVISIESGSTKAVIAWGTKSSRGQMSEGGRSVVAEVGRRMKPCIYTPEYATQKLHFCGPLYTAGTIFLNNYVLSSSHFFFPVLGNAWRLLFC